LSKFFGTKLIIVYDLLGAKIDSSVEYLQDAPPLGYYEDCIYLVYKVQFDLNDGYYVDNAIGLGGFIFKNGDDEPIPLGYAIQQGIARLDESYRPRLLDLPKVKVDGEAPEYLGNGPTINYT
jgi:hypothetical protein